MVVRFRFSGQVHEDAHLMFSSAGWVLAAEGLRVGAWRIDRAVMELVGAEEELARLRAMGHPEERLAEAERYLRGGG